MNQYNYCINKGWDSVRTDISTGISIVPFERVEDGIGYATITINIPEDIQPCTQRFTVSTKCNLYGEENVVDYFDIEVTK